MNQSKPRQSVSVLVPVYNEAATLGTVLERLCQLQIIDQVVVVDDGSTDGSADIARDCADDRVQLVQLPANQGKTSAIRAAVQAATGDVLVVQDADLEYDPTELPSIIQPILDNVADVVYGSRFLVRKAARVLYFRHFIGNKILTFLSNLFTNLNMTDVETCYKAFRAPILKHLDLQTRGFGIEIEVTAAVGALPVRVYEVPISYYGRTYADGKKIQFIDGLYALGYIFSCNFRMRFGQAGRSYVRNVTAALSGTGPDGGPGHNL